MFDDFWQNLGLSAFIDVEILRVPSALSELDMTATPHRNGFSHRWKGFLLIAIGLLLFVVCWWVLEASQTRGQMILQMRVDLPVGVIERSLPVEGQIQFGDTTCDAQKSPNPFDFDQRVVVNYSIEFNNVKWKRWWVYGSLQPCLTEEEIKSSFINWLSSRSGIPEDSFRASQLDGYPGRQN